MKNRLLPVLAFFVITTSLCRAQTPILWGMTEYGGQQDRGIIFSLNSATNVETNVHNFTTGTDGYGPWYNPAFIQANNGLLYGMTWQGGNYNGGAIISYDIATGLESLLHSFGGTGDGVGPFGSLIQANNGLLYGITSEVVGNGAGGAIFSYNITTGVETVIYELKYGVDPRGALIQVNDSLLFYGMTDQGGTSGYGIIFSYNINSGIETVLHNFN